MWLFEENSQEILGENAENTKFELKKAKERNADLIAKQKGLEQGLDKLIKTLKDSQVKILTEKNELNALQEELRKQRKVNMELEEDLKIASARLEVMQSCADEINSTNPTTELKPIYEHLDFKSSVVDCLEKKLIETRLKIAEQEELIKTLEQYKQSLEADIGALSNVEPVTSISRWQDELLVAKLKEADANLEFGKIKRKLANLRKEIQNESMSNVSAQMELAYGDSKYAEGLKKQQNDSLSSLTGLQQEVEHLKIQIEKLEGIKNDITDRLYSNEEIRVQLHEIRAGIYQRTLKREIENDKIISKYKALENKARQEIMDIQKVTDEKSHKIMELEEKISTLQNHNLKTTKMNKEIMEATNQLVMDSLNKEIIDLEEKIESLKNEN